MTLCRGSISRRLLQWRRSGNEHVYNSLRILRLLLSGDRKFLQFPAYFETLEVWRAKNLIIACVFYDDCGLEIEKACASLGILIFLKSGESKKAYNSVRIKRTLWRPRVDP